MKIKKTKTKEILLTAFALLILSSIFFVRPYVVTGGSMEPTYHEGDVLLTESLTKWFRVWRGEVLVIRNPHDHSVIEVKRVVGMPDESVELSSVGVAVTDKSGARTQFAEGTPVGGAANGAFNIKLGPEDYMVLGDNRSKSSDSRTFGAVQKGDIRGHVFLRL